MPDEVPNGAPSNLAIARSAAPSPRDRIRVLFNERAATFWLVGRAPDGLDFARLRVILRDGQSVNLTYGTTALELDPATRRFALRASIDRRQAHLPESARAVFTNEQGSSLQDLALSIERPALVADGAVCDRAGALTRCGDASRCIGDETIEAVPGRDTGRCERVELSAPTQSEAMIDAQGNVRAVARFAINPLNVYATWRFVRPGQEPSPWFAAARSEAVSDEPLYFASAQNTEARPGDRVEWLLLVPPSPTGPFVTVDGEITGVASTESTRGLGDRCLTHFASTCGESQYCDGVDSLFGTCRAQSTECSELAVLPASLPLPSIGAERALPLPTQHDPQPCIIFCAARNSIVTSARIVAPPEGATIELTGESQDGSAPFALSSRCANITFSEARCPAESRRAHTLRAELAPNEVVFVQVTDKARSVAVRRLR
ncbi:MAG: hypothetical protein U0269_22475 [Polyangiales bacterium]